MNFFRIGILSMFLLHAGLLYGQVLNGVVKDAATNENVIGAVVSVKDQNVNAITDVDGKFELTPSGNPPFTLVISYVGYEPQEVIVQSFSDKISIGLKAKEVLLKAVDVTGSRILEKQKEAPLTVESIDIISIRESPQNSFYESLGSLKGVDLTTASLGFTIVNTRGFNSTSPVRSLQLIDGVDNQSPGLNFSLGNFLGASELDVLRVELIAGASSAYYGPNAFNGVINMTTRSPFVKPGLEAYVKAGERSLWETGVRWSQVIKNKEGKEKFGYKLNIFYMRADDWEANNLSPASNSADGVDNPGGYDAVNRYGDEDITRSYDATSLTQQAFYPGLKRWYRTGYLEKDLVNYNSENLKLGAAFHYKIRDSVELILATNFGTGTTVYQGDNRYSLNDVLFYQNRLEIRKPDKYFLRVYSTHEDAGKSYDAVFTAILMQNAAKPDRQWGDNYRVFWYPPGNIASRAYNLPGFPPVTFPYDTAQANAVLSLYSDSVFEWHAEAEDYANNKALTPSNRPFYVPGTARFDSLFDVVTSKKTFLEGGSGFYDKSALYHVQGEYKFNPKYMDIWTGFSYRLYTPKSAGTIFSDTAGNSIRSHEVGIYVGAEKKFINDKLKVTAVIRVDNNKVKGIETVNQKLVIREPLLSPAVSGVYTFNANHLVRLSFSSAIRNPTLADMYQYYNVGRAILLGNSTGYDSLATISSFSNYLNSQTLDRNLIEYFKLDPIEPEKVRTVEAGYRATLFKNLFLDANYYFSWYTDFIGYRIGLKAEFFESPSNFVKSYQVYRISSNASDLVVTQGGSVGLNYFFGKFYAINANYSYNFLDRRGSDDPLIPAYNTPGNKYNIGINGRDMDAKLFGLRLKNVGFNINFKWVEGFLFEGSPQFTGFVDSYGLVDAQVNYTHKQWKTTFKLGASNLLDNQVYLVYGGPLVGRLAYFSVMVNLTD